MLSLEIAGGILLAEVVVRSVSAVTVAHRRKQDMVEENVGLRKQVAYMTSVVDSMSQVMESQGIKVSIPGVETHDHESRESRSKKEITKTTIVDKGYM